MRREKRIPDEGRALVNHSPAVWLPFAIDIGDFDYIENVPEPPPHGVVWAHHLNAAPPAPSPESTLCFAVEHYFREDHEKRMKAIKRDGRLAYERKKRRKLMLALA